jgi:hypothetical protein
LSRRLGHDVQNKWLIAAGVLSGAAAVLHIAIIFGGPDWYRFFGAGEKMAHAAQFGSVRPTLFAVAIAAVLLAWALYAFSGAQLIRPLPLLRTGLVVISTIYLARALAPVAFLIVRPDAISPFWIWSSLVVLVYGACYAVGTWQAWRDL